MREEGAADHASLLERPARHQQNSCSMRQIARRTLVAFGIVLAVQVFRTGRVQLDARLPLASELIIPLEPAATPHANDPLGLRTMCVLIRGEMFRSAGQMIRASKGSYAEQSAACRSWSEHAVRPYSHANWTKFALVVDVMTQHEIANVRLCLHDSGLLGATRHVRVGPLRRTQVDSVLASMQLLQSLQAAGELEPCSGVLMLRADLVLKRPLPVVVPWQPEARKWIVAPIFQISCRFGAHVKRHESIDLPNVLSTLVWPTLHPARVVLARVADTALLIADVSRFVSALQRHRNALALHGLCSWTDQCAILSREQYDSDPLKEANSFYREVGRKEGDFDQRHTPATSRYPAGCTSAEEVQRSLLGRLPTTFADLIKSLEWP